MLVLFMMLEVQMTCRYGVCISLFLFLLSSLLVLVLVTEEFIFNILGFVGELHPDKNSDNGKHVLYTHKNIVIKYNKDQVCGF